MGMLKENSAHPLGDRKQEHVVAKRGRPIRHSETDAFARDHAAATNQQQCGETRKPHETIAPFVVAAVSDRLTIRDGYAHGCKNNRDANKCDDQRSLLERRRYPLGLAEGAGAAGLFPSFAAGFSVFGAPDGGAFDPPASSARSFSHA